MRRRREQCLRCRWTWWTRVRAPVSCPCCRSYRWRIPPYADAREDNEADPLGAQAEDRLAAPQR
jgi:hypothetical protein